MLSALICAKNEINNIEACIQTLAFADEVVVIDDHSTDDDKKWKSSIQSGEF